MFCNAFQLHPLLLIKKLTCIGLIYTGGRLRCLLRMTSEIKYNRSTHLTNSLVTFQKSSLPKSRTNIAINSQDKFHTYISLHVTDHVFKAVDERGTTAMILIDLSKAFESLSHNLLLRKLQDLGNSESSTKWFESSLTERYRLQSV